jgi:hypothetical protein
LKREPIKNGEESVFLFNNIAVHVARLFPRISGQVFKKKSSKASGLSTLGTVIKNCMIEEATINLENTQKKDFQTKPISAQEEPAAGRGTQIQVCSSSHTQARGTDTIHFSLKKKKQQTFFTHRTDI